MAALSKHTFDKAASTGITCARFLHPSTESCSKAVLKEAISTVIGSSKFFFIVYASIIKWKDINKQFMKKQLHAYLRSVIFFTCYGLTFHSSGCLIRKCTDQFSFYCIAFSGMFAGLAIFIETEENRSLDTAICTNLVAEIIFRYLYWKNTVSRTTLKETFLFMTCSATLMYLLKTRKTGTKITSQWFYYPSRITSNRQSATNAELCTHEVSCNYYFYKGFTTYFAIGYVMQLLKHIAPRINTIIFSPRSMLQAVVSKDKFLFGLLLGGYVGIYRIISCLLRRKDKEEKPFHSIVAGFLAGSSYFFKPTLPLAAIAFTTTFQLLIQRITYINDLQSKLPLTEIAFVLCNGFMLHNFFFLPDSCPKYLRSMLAISTKGKSNELYASAWRLFG